MNELPLNMPDQEAGHFDDMRISKILAELSHALGQTDRDILAAWGRRSGRRLAGLLFCRVGAFARLAGKLVNAGIKEGRNFAGALHDGRGAEQIGDRVAAAIDTSIYFARDARLALSRFSNALTEDPKRNIPTLVASVLGFYAGSGGLDGNGGIPDLDLMAGIGLHRSLLTHSIVSGVIAEGLLLALMDLSGEIKDRLPEEHDPLWDRLADLAAQVAAPLLTGTSAGIAYHLLVDATLQPAAYHGLPWHMPMHDHEAAMGANGLAEGAYAVGIGRMDGVHCNVGREYPSAKAMPGRKVVDGVAKAASKVGGLGRRWYGSLGANS